MSSKASAKVVDCILALKSYHDWKQGGALGFWRLKSPTDSGSCVTSSRYMSHCKNPNPRRRWLLSSDQESLDGTSLSSSPEQSANFLGFHKESRASFDDVMRLDHSGQDCMDGRREERSPSPVTSASTSSWLQDIRHKFSEVLQVKAKRSTQDPLPATEEYGGGATMTFDHNAPSQSLLSLISAIIGDKPAEEVPMLVEFMLRKVMEEFERHLLNQRNQVTKAINPSLFIAKMKTALRDIMVREEKLASQKMVLEALGSCTQEEVKNMEEQKRLKEDVDNEKHSIKHVEDNHLLHLENAKKEMEMECKERMSMLQTQVTESKKKLQETEYQSSSLKGLIREKDDKWQKSLHRLLKDFKDLRWWQLDAKEEILRLQFDWKDRLKKLDEVFLDTQPLIRSVLDGFNVCIFAYGQTGSGKTFTMSGPTNMTPTNWGVNYRALNDLFQITQTRVHVFRYEIGVQMLEIYNEQVRDLLAIDGSHKKLEIRNNSQLNGLNVPDATIMPVKSTDDVVELMRLGQKNRAVGSTSLNDRSSRSHSVVTVHVQGTELDSGNIFRGSLHLVDLAGSERVDKSEVTGDRLKEAQHINKSLSALGDVISALAQKNGHVPYRNSKLTQLLQDSLGGQAKTLMFVHISPDAESFGETMSTLKFAERVATVELGAARSNKESGEMQILKDQVNQLKDVVTKKDAEITVLHTTIQQLEKVDNTDNPGPKSKSKPTNSSKSRRHTRNETQPQKNRKMTAENGNANAEARQSMRKNPGGKKTPTSLAMSSPCHDPEDSTELFESSSACSPLDSPSENKLPFEDYEQLKTENGRYAAGALQSTSDAEMLRGGGGCSNMPSGLRLRPHSNVYSGTTRQEPANGSFETILLETIGGTIVPSQNVQDLGGKRTSFLLNNVGLDEDYGDESEVFESRGTCQDDTASLYSDSGISAEADISESSQVDQAKKGRASSSRPHYDRKGMLQSEVSPTSVTSTSRASPMKGERKSTGGLIQVRHRKQKTAGPAAATSDKPPPKRNAPLPGNSNQEVEHASMS